MDIEKLTAEVQHLRSLGREGGYWDFKREWHQDRADLLLDIICLANNLVNRDAYLILGVLDVKQAIYGVGSDPNRMNLNALSQFISGNGKRFSGFYPEIDLQTIIIEGQEIDVIIIRNTNHTPYYLEKNFSDDDFPQKSGGKDGRVLIAGRIYIREDDHNIGIKNPPPPHCVEYLWKKRFGLHLPVLDRLRLLLTDTAKWTHAWGNKDYFYHEDFPDFRLQKVGDLQWDWCPPAAFYAHPIMHSCKFHAIYQSTIIYETELWCFDEFRKYLPAASICSPDGINDFWYWYYDLSSINGKLLSLFTDGTNNISSREPNYNQFLIFNNLDEKESFDAFLLQHFDTHPDALIQKKYSLQIEDEKKVKEGNVGVHSALHVGKAAEIYLAWQKARNEFKEPSL